MGNCLSPCYIQNHKSEVKLIFYGGRTIILSGRHVAGEILFEFPEMIVCHSNSFFIGHSIPSLSINDNLIPGETYFVLPIDCFSSETMSASSLAALGSSPSRSPMKFSEQPFQYLKSSNGAVLIKVVPEFMTKLISGGKECDESSGGDHGSSFLCNTPELQKHYDQLVGSKAQVWSPKLETITEYKIKYSPCRFIGFERKQKEK